MVVLTKQFDPSIVALSIAVSYLGTYACICVSEQFRMYCKVGVSGLTHPFIMLILMAISLGSVSIWSMHFMSMYGMTLINPETGDIVESHCRLDYMLGSLATIIATSFVGMFIASRSRNFFVTSDEVVADFIIETRAMTIQQLRNMQSKKKLLLDSLTQDLSPIFKDEFIGTKA
jgi:NO-binding membrane sensor protein with MHYT domain